MAKLFSQNNVLLGEELSKQMPLDAWIAEIIQSRVYPHDGFVMLGKEGKYFDKRCFRPPPDIIRPDRIERSMCVLNNVQYVTNLFFDCSPTDIEDFRFVAGVYGCTAITENVPSDKQYVISTHAFMSYKGAVLDWTSLRHPHLCYKATHYFGIEFEIKAVMNVIGAIMNQGSSVSAVSILSFLRNEPYLK